MTVKSPRIYTYKITFEEVPYYYYGVHKERKYNEKYFGRPVTHKWCWKHYTPQKQILQVFEYSDKGWLEALEVERSIIKQFYQTDKWCLNENCGGLLSLETSRKSAKLGGQKSLEMGVGVHGLTKKQLIENGKKGAAISKKKGKGAIFSTKEQLKEYGQKGGIVTRDRKVGIHGIPTEERSRIGSKTKKMGVGIHGLTKDQRVEIGLKLKEMGLGIHGLSKEQMTENAKKGAAKCKELGVGVCVLTKEQRKIIADRVADKLSIEFCFKSPLGEIVEGKNLTRFAKEHNLSRSCLRNVMKGKSKQHKGWTLAQPNE